MEVIDLPLDKLVEAPWNSNTMAEKMLGRLKASIRSFGLVGNFVVRPMSDGDYEVLSGNQRLWVLKELGYTSAPCVIVDMDEAHAKLLAQALNNLHGEDDLGLKAELLREVLERLTQEEVLSVLPETSATLAALSDMGQETMAEHLRAWQEAQGARLSHFQAQLTAEEHILVERVFERIMPEVRRESSDNPNIRGRALYRLCRWFEEAHHV